MLSIAKDYKPYTPKHSIYLSKTIEAEKTEPMTEERATEKVGVSKSYFSQLKNWNPVIYRFMRLHGKGDMKKGYDAWKEYRERITDEFAATYINKYGYVSCMARLTGLCNNMLRIMYRDMKKGSFNNITRIKNAKKVISVYRVFYENS